MKSLVKALVASVTAVLAFAAPAMAQGGTTIEFSGAFGAGLTVIGGAYGIGRLAGCALESMARQPEVAARIQTAMIIAAALIEGFTFFALVICLLQDPFGAG